MQVLKDLGYPIPPHYSENLSLDDVKRGYEIFYTGKTKSPEGKQGEIQSKYFQCVNCHNTVREDPDLKLSDPETRLDYALQANIPFLQGTTMFGTANKDSWYNGDYFKKYGDWVKPANKSLAEAIQLCGRECSQGRELNEWELRAMLAYLQSLEYKMGDLGLTDKDWSKLREEAKERGEKSGLIAWIKSFYLNGSPATFADVPINTGQGYPFQGKAEDGKIIYEISCKNCHKPYGVSDFILDESKLTFKKLKKNISKDTPYSIYNAVRKGTIAEEGHHAYMPLYPAERMSDRQVEDLRAYILQRAN